MSLEELLRCPEREDNLPHEWAGTNPERGGDPRNSCRHCGRPGRDNVFEGETGGFFAEATAMVSEPFFRIRAPMQSGTGSPHKAWPQGMPPEMVKRASEIVAEKKERDRVARESGVGRPGQLRGKS